MSKSVNVLAIATHLLWNRSQVVDLVSDDVGARSSARWDSGRNRAAISELLLLPGAVAVRDALLVNLVEIDRVWIAGRAGAHAQVRDNWSFLCLGQCLTEERQTRYSRCEARKSSK